MINANLGVKKHMSMIAVPKLLRCYDWYVVQPSESVLNLYFLYFSDSVIDRKRTQAHCDCHSQVGRDGGRD